MGRTNISTTALSLTIILVIGTIANADDDQWVSLFDGKTIEGWTRQGGYATYEAKDGMIVGTTADGSRNTFLCKGPFSDFILELEVLCDKELNSGVPAIHRSLTTLYLPMFSDTPACLSGRWISLTG